MDIAWWTGLGKIGTGETLNDMRGNIKEVDVPEIKDRLVISASDMGFLDDLAAAEPVVNLLPVKDPYFMDYKRRGRYLADEILRLRLRPLG